MISMTSKNKKLPKFGLNFKPDKINFSQFRFKKVKAVIIATFLNLNMAHISSITEQVHVKVET